MWRFSVIFLSAILLNSFHEAYTQSSTAVVSSNFTSSPLATPGRAVGPVSPPQFNDANSDEWDSSEARRIFPPSSTERLLPPACGRPVPRCDPSYSFRSYDGSCNNLQNPLWGVPNSTYHRLLPPVYGDGIRRPRRATDNSPLPPARKLRTTLFPTGDIISRFWTVIFTMWGQFMAHDMSLLKQPDHKIRCCSSTGQVQGKVGPFCFPIKVSPTDPTMGQEGIRCMNFTRTVTDKDLGCSPGPEPAEQINTVTSYMDLSNVYGNDRFTARSLRSFVGGRLRTVTRNNRIYPPREFNKNDFCPCNRLNENTCYKTGDSRSNQTPLLAILQIIFLREHNRLARELATINPHWRDERLYQEARRINIAQYQHISYYEWLPIILDTNLLINNQIIGDVGIQDYMDDYDDTEIPDISQEHAHGAFRHFHTNIAGIMQLMDRHNLVSSIQSITDWFNRPMILEQSSNMEKITMGMISQNLQEFDTSFVLEISDHLLACPDKQYGIDMKATDIQRDRDHGLAYYDDYRQYCGQSPAQSFDDFGPLIEPSDIDNLKLLYKSHRDVDLSVGGGLEPSRSQGIVFNCILNEQFLRTRRADRFWFEHPQAGFTIDQLSAIRKTTVSLLFCRNGDGVNRIQHNGFDTPTRNVGPCSNIPTLDLSLWAE